MLRGTPEILRSAASDASATSGEFHPITAYLFVEYKCNLDCWYCWSFNNRVRGMTEDVARRSIDWLHDHGCRVVALMGGEPLLRPDFAHKVVDPYIGSRQNDVAIEEVQVTGSSLERLRDVGEIVDGDEICIRSP